MAKDNGTTLQLTPQELYFCGTLMQAKYIDYAYVAAMGDIQKNRAVYESTAREGLCKKGVLMEDFSGNLEMDDQAKALLVPIFFGEIESSVDLAKLELRENENHKFHLYEGRITQVELEEGNLTLTEADDVDLQQYVGGILEHDYPEGTVRYTSVEWAGKQYSRILVLKNTVIGKSATINIYVECEGRMFYEKDGQAQSMTRQEFVQSVYRGLTANA